MLPNFNFLIFEQSQSKRKHFEIKVYVSCLYSLKTEISNFHGSFSLIYPGYIQISSRVLGFVLTVGL